MSDSGISMHSVVGDTGAAVEPSRVVLYKVSDRAKRYRDLGDQAKQKELFVKMGLLVGALVLAAGVAVGIYYCCTSPYYTYTNCSGRVITENYAGLSVVPGVPGGLGVIGLIVGAILVDFEAHRNGHKSDRMQAGEHAERVFLLTQKSLDEIYAMYYKKNDGLKYLVREGYMTPKQADNLRETMKSYDHQVKKQAEYTSQPIVKTAIENGTAQPAEYMEASKEIERLQEAWTQIQQEIKDQYQEISI